jgi:hypothetical protein
MQEFQDQKIAIHGDSKQRFSDKSKKDMNKKITENIQNWLNMIELDGHFGNL